MAERENFSANKYKNANYSAQKEFYNLRAWSANVIFFQDGGKPF